MAVAARGLSTADLTTIRESLAAGRRPKVVFTASAGQVVGKLGQVIELTDPNASEEWIVVRFGRDELPFAPSDLAIAAKAPPAKRTDSKADGATDSKAQPRFDPPLLAGQRPTPTPVTIPTPREESRMPATSGNAPTTHGAPSDAGPGNSPASDGGGSAKQAKAGKPKAPPSLTVTLAYTDREWTIAAQQGAKTLAKPYVIRPAEALRVVALVDVPGVHEAVETIIEAERIEAEGRASKLREELAEIESRLADLTN
jgi:hypothetical protein